MTSVYRQVDKLREEDLLISPVWEFADEEYLEETVVKPIATIPVKSLSGRVVATHVRLSNSDTLFAILGNIDLNNTLSTQQFLTLSIPINQAWFTLARYHDFDFAKRGPAALADLLSLPVGMIFPISYDIRSVAEGRPDVLEGKIHEVPEKRLSKSELLDLTFSRGVG